MLLHLLVSSCRYVGVFRRNASRQAGRQAGMQDERFVSSKLTVILTSPVWCTTRYCTVVPNGTRTVLVLLPVQSRSGVSKK
jgi:hypothetical protein